MDAPEKNSTQRLRNRRFECAKSKSTKGTRAPKSISVTTDRANNKYLTKSTKTIVQNSDSCNVNSCSKIHPHEKNDTCKRNRYIPKSQPVVPPTSVLNPEPVKVATNSGGTIGISKKCTNLKLSPGEERRKIISDQTKAWRHSVMKNTDPQLIPPAGFHLLSPEEKKKIITRFNFHFIHIPKNAGTYIHQRLHLKYNVWFYGMRNMRIGDVVKKYSIDHLTCDELIDEGYINVFPTHTFCIVREPIDRFKSLCCMHKLSPDILIDRIKTKALKNGHWRPQFDYMTCRGKPIHERIFKIDDLDQIDDYCKMNGIPLSPRMDVITRAAVVKLEDRHLEFIREYYVTDFKVFENPASYEKHTQ